MKRHIIPASVPVCLQFGSCDLVRPGATGVPGQPGNFERHHRISRKNSVLNKVILATQADYLVFTDGDCILAPDFIDRHLEYAQPGFYLAGSIIRLSRSLSAKITRDAIRDARAFDTGWLVRNGRSFNRRYLRLYLNRRALEWLDRKLVAQPEDGGKFRVVDGLAELRHSGAVSLKRNPLVPTLSGIPSHGPCSPPTPER